jgi:outer membrane protein OmpA-like peptidoglycan-associated protein
MVSRTTRCTLPLTALALAGVATLGACASTPTPPELMDARSAYIRAEGGQAAQYKPDQLHEAKVALDQAERSYIDSPGKQKTRDLAYVAEQKAKLAESQAREAKAAQDRAQAEKDYQLATQAQLAQTRSELNATGQALQGTAQSLAAEKNARIEAEKRARETMDKVAIGAGSVRLDTRGTVITLPGSVLFASSKTVLLPGAQDKLNLVAEALKDQTGKIVVEGHTDSQGGDASNQELSQGRAQAVRDYLVARGVPSDRIQARGLAATRPIADNKTPEGRASNRRVEIVVPPSASDEK